MQSRESCGRTAGHGDAQQGDFHAKPAVVTHLDLAALFQGKQERVEISESSPPSARGTAEKGAHLALAAREALLGLFLEWLSVCVEFRIVGAELRRLAGGLLAGGARALVWRDAVRARVGRVGRVRVDGHRLVKLRCAVHACRARCARVAALRSCGGPEMRRVPDAGERMRRLHAGRAGLRRRSCEQGERIQLARNRPALRRFGTAATSDSSPILPRPAERRRVYPFSARRSPLSLHKTFLGQSSGIVALVLTS